MNRGEGSVNGNRRWVAGLALLGLVGSLLAVGAPPGGGVDGEADATARYSACVGPALESLDFADIIGSFAEDAVNCLAHYGVTKGRTATSYDPDAPVLRWQMALFMARAAGPAGIVLPPASDQGFSDIGRFSEEARDAINQMAELEIMLGEGRGRFGPNTAVPRAEMALILEAFLERAEVGAGGEDVSEVAPDDDVFDDVDNVTRGEYQAIRLMFEMGVTLGTSRNRYTPRGSVTRAQMAVFITRTLAHTVARPTGLTLQADQGTVTLGESVELVASVRGRRQTPVPDELVDVFFAADPGEAFNSNGSCNTREVEAVWGSAACEISYGDDVTGPSGDLEITFTPEESVTVWAWSSSVGDSYDDDVDADRASVVRVRVAKGADGLRVTDDMADHSQYARFGQRVTFTLQLVDDEGNSVSESGRSVTVSIDETVARGDGGSVSNRSQSRRAYQTDQSGRVTLSFRPSDPRPSSRDTGDRAELDLDVDAPAGLELVDDTALEMAGGGAGDGPAAVWADEPAAPASLTISQPVSYHEASAGGRGAVNTVTAVLVDQYGGALSRNRVNFFSDDPVGIGAANDGSARWTRTTNRAGRATLSYNRDSDESGVERIWAQFTDPRGAGAADDIDLRSERIDHYWAEEATGAVTGALLDKDTSRNRLVISGAARAVLLIKYDGNDQLNNLDGPSTLANFEAHLGHTGMERPAPKQVVTRVRVDNYAPHSRDVSRLALLGGFAAVAQPRAVQALLSDDLTAGQSYLKMDQSRTVTFTVQIADSLGNPIRESGWRIAVTSTETPVGGSAGTARTRTVTTDDMGRAAFSFTMAGTAATGETAKVVYEVGEAAKSGVELPVVDRTTGGVVPDDDSVTADRGKFRVRGQDAAAAAAALVIEQSKEFTAASSAGSGAEHTITARIVDQYGETVTGATNAISFMSDDENGLWADGYTSSESDGKRVLGGTPRSGNQTNAAGGAASHTYRRDSAAGAIETIWATGGGFTSNRLYHYWAEPAAAPVTGRILAADAAGNRLVIFARERVMLVNYDSNDQLSSLNGSRGLASFEGDFGEGEAAHLRVEAYNPGRVSRLELRPEWAAVDHPDGPVTGAAGRFGQSFAADDGVLVIGGGYESVTTASGDCQSGCDRAGRVYVYEGIGDTSPAVLQAPTPKARDYYGYDVDISGDTIVVGAPRVDHIGSGATAADNGQVFVYVRPAGGWRSGMQPTAAFTNSGLGASGTLAAVVDGSTYPACPTYPGRNHRFGDGVAISRDERTVVVTSRDARSPAHNCAASVHTDGMAYVFERNDNGTAGWENDNGAGRAVLWPSTTVERQTGQENEEFGRERSVSVSNDGGVIVIGMAFRDIESNGSWLNHAGSAYVFVRSGSEWNTGNTPVTHATAEAAVLAAPTPAALQRMGKLVAVSGDGNTVAASGHFRASQNKPGEMYVFTKPSGGWADSTSAAVLKAERGRNQDVFGQYVAMNNEGTVVAAGVHYRQEGDFRGSVALFNRPSGGWADDSTVDEEFLGAAVNGHLGWQTMIDKTTGDLYSAYRHEPASGGRLLTVFHIPR